MIPCQLTGTFDTGQIIVQLIPENNLVAHNVDLDFQLKLELDSNAKAFKEMTSLLSTMQFDRSEEFDVGDLCVAKYTDGNWYRAEIVEVSTSTVQVRFIDYGNYERIVKAELRDLPLTMRVLPSQAVTLQVPTLSKQRMRDIEAMELAVKLIEPKESVADVYAFSDGEYKRIC